MLLSVTGVLMFFHLDSGLNKLAHQWFSWLLLMAVIAHAASNGAAFKRYFMLRRAQLILLLMLVLTVMTFLPVETRKPNPQKMAVMVLESATLGQVAALKGKTLKDMQIYLRSRGFSVQDQDASLQEISKQTKVNVHALLSDILSAQ